jgi:hypothetical protein
VIIVAPLNDQIRNSYRSAKHALLQSSNLLAMTATEQVPAKAGNGASYTVEGLEPEGHTRFFVDHDFLKTYGIGVAAGRDFDEKISTDATGAFLINEAFVRMAQWKSPAEAIGRSITMGHGGQTFPGKIVGVVKDFNIFSFRETVWPLVINIMPMDKLNFISFRISRQNVTEACGASSRQAIHSIIIFSMMISPACTMPISNSGACFKRLHRSPSASRAWDCSASPPSPPSAAPKRSACAKCSARR